MANIKDNAGDQVIDAVVFDAPSSTVNKSQQSTDITPPSKPGSLLAVRSDAPWWQSQFNLMLFVFALLGLAAGLFILLTPAPNTAAVSTVVSAGGETSVSQSVISDNNDDEDAPWDESRRKQARTDSQDILADLLNTQKELDAKNVDKWGAEAYDAAIQQASEGDEFYKRKDFVSAVQSYQSALTKMQSLDSKIPDVIEGLVADGVSAIEQGKTNLARENFQEALKMDQNHIPALRGLDRSNNLDQVLDLLRAADLDEKEFEISDKLESLNLAAEKHQQALALDPRMEQAKLGAKRLADKIADKKYRDAMSKGFADLFAGRYSGAKSGFSKAIQIKPDDKVANSAYRQSLASDKRSSLSSLIKSAKNLEKSEEWASALSTYQAVLQRDPNQVSAKLGSIRSKVRKELDQSIVKVLADSLALSRASQRANAEQVLADARGIKAKGPLLKKQISEMASALKQLDATIKVSFSSDSLTDVTLRKQGSSKISLGKFRTKNLALKPGRYVVSGVRLGYKDERQEIELRAKSEGVQSFNVACTERISSVGTVSN